MANFDINNFVFDRAIRGTMQNTDTKEIMWSINQISEPSLSITSETAEVVDAIGTTVATFNRGKKAEFSANNSMFDLGLYASQNGVEKEIATEEKTISSPIFDDVVVKVADGVVTGELQQEPNMVNGALSLPFVYIENGDGTLKQKLKVGTNAETEVTISGKTLTFPTSAGVKAGDVVFAQYSYDAKRAVAITGDAIHFPKAGIFTMDCLGGDVCNPSASIYAYMEFPNAKLDANVDMTFTAEGNHPFKIICQQAYCDKEKVLFRLVIPD